MAIKVLVVDDQTTVQEIIRSYIEDDPNLELVACANNGQEALDLIEVHRPHIVLMDIEMPVLDGLTATKIITEKYIDTNVLIISVHNEETYLNNALKVGAKGYLLKNTPAKELIHAIYSGYKGYFQLGPGLLENYLHRVGESTTNAQELEQIKSFVFQQFQNKDDRHNSSSVKSKNRRKSANSNSKDYGYLVNQYANLEQRVFIISNHIEKLNKKINLLQQFLAIFILCLIVLLALFFLFTL